MLKALAEEDESGGAENEWDVAAPEAVFGPVGSFMGADVAIAVPVVEPVTPEFADDCAGRRGEVEEAHGCWTERGGGGYMN